MVKFAKNDRLDSLIILARDEQILFFLENDPKGGPLDDFSVDETLQFCSFFTCL